MVSDLCPVERRSLISRVLLSDFWVAWNGNASVGVAGHGRKNGGDFFHLQLDTHHRHCNKRLGSGRLRVATCRFSAPYETFLTESPVRHVYSLPAERKTCWTLAVHKVVDVALVVRRHFCKRVAETLPCSILVDGADLASRREVSSVTAATRRPGVAGWAFLV